MDKKSSIVSFLYYLVHSVIFEALMDNFEA